jgi:hypothetical protein
VLGCRKTKRLHERFLDLGLEMRAAFIGSSADRLSAFNPISSVVNKHSATGNYLLLQVTTGRSIPSGEDGSWDGSEDPEMMLVSKTLISPSVKQY